MSVETTQHKANQNAKLSRLSDAFRVMSDQEFDPVELRAYLDANNGIKGLEILQPHDVDEAVRLFRRDGFVVVADVLDEEQIDFLAKGCEEVVGEIVALENQLGGNRGPGRYSFGGSSMTRSQLHRPEWQMLLDVPSVDRIVSAIFGSNAYVLRAASGDFCMPGTLNYQPLHSDCSDWKSADASPYSAFYDPQGVMSVRDLPCPYLCVNFLPQAITRLNGPTRQIPGTQNSRAPIPTLAQEPEWMKLSTVCPAPAGAVMIRDVRAWHSGSPNVSNAMRAIPNIELYAPWFREPIKPGISYQAFQQLSDRAQQIARESVADSGVDLKTGPVVFAP